MELTILRKTGELSSSWWSPKPRENSRMSLNKGDKSFSIWFRGFKLEQQSATAMKGEEVGKLRRIRVTGSGTWLQIYWISVAQEGASRLWWEAESRDCKNTSQHERCRYQIWMPSIRDSECARRPLRAVNCGCRQFLMPPAMDAAISFAY